MEKTKKKRGFVKALRGVLIGVAAVILILVLAFLALTLTEYKPKDVEKMDPPVGTDSLALGRELTIVSFNTGYAALGENADFFMDGGKTTMPENKEEVETNIAGISKTLQSLGADIYMLQEVDTDSKRSFHINEAEAYSKALDLPNSYALNYSSAFVPFPVSSMMGKVNSGLATYTGLAVSDAERIQLPIPFSWPVRCFNLKRCLLIDRIPIDGSDKELVIINLHLEAYDSGEGKIAQTKMLYDLLSAEYEKGNYVIAGGDFNQTFPGAYYYEPLKEGNWMPGTLENDLPEGFKFVFDDSKPTCRLLDVPYKGNPAPQYYIIDGFIVSENVSVSSVEVVSTDFVNSDHQPVKLVITLN
ncbi:MAG: endonuclease [Clostridiales bacterium]|nr:endonuclease [Clostridiales bacterium]